MYTREKLISVGVVVTVALACSDVAGARHSAPPAAPLRASVATIGVITSPAYEDRSYVLQRASRSAVIRAMIHKNAHRAFHDHRPASRQVRVPLPIPQVRHTIGTSSRWDRIAACESGNNWHINTGNGYSGGLQMDAEFWRTYDGFQFASAPYLASREQQIIVAERARDGYKQYPARGYSPWPVCGGR